MSNLEQTLKQMQAYVLNEDDSILPQTLDFERISAKDRAAVYRNGYYLRIIEILEKHFPTVRHLMGDEQFHRICRKYIDAFPSNHFNICRFGRNFERFLREYADMPEHYAELANYEYLIITTEEALDAPQISWEQVTEVNPEQWALIQLKQHPTVSFVHYKFNVPLIRQAHDDEKAIPEVAEYDEPVWWMVWRFDRKVRFVSIDTHQKWILNTFEQGMTFGDVCEGLCQWFEEEKVPEFAAVNLRNWAVEGVFSQLMIQDV